MPTSQLAISKNNSLISTTNITRATDGRTNIANIATESINPESINRIKSLNPKKTCQNYLNYGHWNSSIFKSHSLFDCDNNSYCKKHAFVSSAKCEEIKYTPDLAQQCFTKKLAILLGDSRGRQLYLALKTRLIDKPYLIDDVGHGEQTETRHGGSFKYFWTTSIGSLRTAGS